MALTAGSCAPIRPYSIGGGTSQGSVPIYANVNASQTCAIGDILVLSSGKATKDSTVPTATAILGVVAQPVTSGASVTDADLVSYYPAHKSAVFVGSLVGSDKDTDLTAPGYTTAHLFAGTTAAFDIDVPTSVFTFPVIVSGANTADNAVVIGYARDQLKGQNFTSGSGGTVNPRVLFIFQTSVFNNLTA